MNVSPAFINAVLGVPYKFENMQFNDLVGKTIKAVQELKLKEYDDQGYLLMEFTDGAKALIVAVYGSYTGESEDEYPTYLRIEGEDDGIDMARYEVV